LRAIHLLTISAATMASRTPEDAIVQAKRPLSPHLQIYRWPLSMMMSIMHRATGIALSVGLLLMVWWLVALASGPDAFDQVHSLAGSWFGLLVLFGLTIVWAFHLMSGIRHMIWDTGRGMGIHQLRPGAMLVLGGTAALTILVWIAVLIAR
jgi:succinate dehydrogenase / fumarate reductase cytochrome b subunit